MPLATIIFSGRDWLWPAVAAFVALFGAIAWSYWRSPAPGGVKAACALLKLAGVAALLLCLLEPLGTSQRARPGANYFAVVADNSEGMKIKDRGDTKTRADLLRETLGDAGHNWRERLGESFQVRQYFFDTRLQSTRDFTELQFDGRASSIGGALRSLADRYRGQPLAGVILLTDGNATDLSGGTLNTDGIPPIYPVIVGRDDAIPDLSIQKIGVTQTAFEDTPVTVQVDVGATGYGGESIVAQLIDPSATVTNALPGGASDKVVMQQILRAGRDDEPLPFRFQFRPDKPGVSFYQVRVAAKGEEDQFQEPGRSREATLANNSRVVVVDRGGGPYRILYVSGRPNWEFKFLNRALDEEHEQLQLVGLIRIAKREPKFEFRGRAGESSNPLYRGFGNQSKEEIERYDQPVLIRLNTRDQAELAGGFPKTAEDLYAYHAIIIDDLEAEFFTHDQQVLLQKFVSERGGGFLMLGGQESYVQGKYDRTPVADLLPVYMDHVSPGLSPSAHGQLNLTREGWLQPWARVRSTESDEQSRLENMQPFQIVNRVREIKPGASVIATVTDEAGKTIPAIAVQRYGLGRSAAMMIGDFWRWGFHDDGAHRDMDRAWRQLTRWLVSDVPGQVSLSADPRPDDPNGTMELSVRVRDPKFQPLDNARVSLRVRAFPVSAVTNGPNLSATNLVLLNAEPANEGGLYQAGYVPRLTGGYKAEVVVTNAAGAEVGRAEAGWTADPAADEFRSLKPNRSLMESIARKTGGEVVSLADLDKFVGTLPSRKAPVTDSHTYPLWHRPSVLLLALICFAAEWGLRRVKGLP
ncbi:MAG TPA: hypothetical protein VHH73_04210 [Verrucomicrobiae bacterium]|nr:hypothetical protein [Verrucomicrobiae bacterium]